MAHRGSSTASALLQELAGATGHCLPAFPVHSWQAEKVHSTVKGHGQCYLCQPCIFSPARSLWEQGCPSLFLPGMLSRECVLWAVCSVLLGLICMGRPHPLYTSVHCSSAQLYLLQQKSTFCFRSSAGHCTEMAEIGWLCWDIFSWFSGHEFFSSCLCFSGDAEEKALKEFISKY